MAFAKKPSSAEGRLLDAIREQERARIARDLHDQTAQLLVVMQLKIGQLKRAAPQGADELIHRLEETVAEIRQQVRGYL